VGLTPRGPWVVGGCGYWLGRCLGLGEVPVGAHADLCDLEVGGHLASFGLPWRRRAGCQASPGVTLGSAIAPTASDPALRCFQPGTADRCCEDRVGSEPFCAGDEDGEQGAFLGRVRVRRCSSPSTSFVLAALRALQVDSSCVSGADRRDRGSPLSCSGPARRVVGGVVADQCVGDAGGTVCQCAGDDPAGLAARF
jgi:hypothetical protein